MTFTRPTIGPKVYLSRGPSGLPETFIRSSADRELVSYLGHVTLKIAVDGFIRKMALARRAETWADILEHLGELTQVDDTDLIPLDVTVAFWAQVDQARAATKTAKLLAKAN